MAQQLSPVNDRPTASALACRGIYPVAMDVRRESLRCRYPVSPEFQSTVARVRRGAYHVPVAIYEVASETLRKMFEGELPPDPDLFRRTVEAAKAEVQCA